MIQESLPTSSFLLSLAGVLFKPLPMDLEGCLLVSSAEESAVLSRFSIGEETEEVLRRLLAAGAYRCIDRCLFLSRCLRGLVLRLKAFTVALGLEFRS